MADKTNPARREQMIAEAAYFRAERRGFLSGDPVRDWCEAEAEVDARLRQTDDERLLVDRLEEGLAAASKKLAALKKKMSGLTAEARVEWQRDVERLGKLRESLQVKLEEIREQGAQTGQRARQQAEKIRKEIIEVVQRVGAGARH